MIYFLLLLLLYVVFIVGIIFFLLTLIIPFTIKHFINFIRHIRLIKNKHFNIYLTNINNIIVKWPDTHSINNQHKLIIINTSHGLINGIFDYVKYNTLSYCAKISII